MLSIYKRICCNNALRSICIINKFVICVSFGNIIKIINVRNINILADFVVSSSSHIYGFCYKKENNKKYGILIAHGVHKIYIYKLYINLTNEKCLLKLLKKYCTNKWILKTTFFLKKEDDMLFSNPMSSTYERHKNEKTHNIDKINNIENKDLQKIKNILIISLSNGSILLLDIYKGISSLKYKFIGIHLLYSSDIFIKHQKKCYNIYVVGGTPFNKILLWSFKINKKDITKYWCAQTNKNNNINNNKIIIPIKHFEELCGHRGIIFKVKFFKSTKYICSVSDDREGRVWYRMKNEEYIKKTNKRILEKKKNTYQMNEPSLYYYTCIKILTGHNARVWDIDMGKFKNKLFFFTCSEDSMCNVYSKNQNKFFKYSNNSSSTIRCILYHHYMQLIISGSDNGTLHIKPITSFFL